MLEEIKWKQEEQGWRVFCAVELPTEIRARVAAHIARLRLAMPEKRAAWVTTEKIHITLKFFGDVKAPRVHANLLPAVERATANSGLFDLSIEGTGAFPARGAARVLWLGVADYSGKLAELHERLEDEMEREGFTREAKSFHPHLTLARLREPKDARALAQAHKLMPFEPVSFSVAKLAVIRSELDKKGSRYTALAHCPLESDL